MYKVSIVTVSHFSRANFLKILFKCIKTQDYSDILEWIIIDASIAKQSISNLENIVNDFKNNFLPKIIYHKSEKKYIGAWRNEYNKLANGDIILCMDDDDYYPPQRISHAIDVLSTRKNLIVGCDKIFMYDIHYDKVYQMKGFTPNHSTNNCMAYWKEYLINHTYDETVSHAEENSFTNNFSEPMGQLDPLKTVIQINHGTNTFNKKIIIYQNYFLPPEQKYLLEKNITFHDWVLDKNIYEDYHNIFKDLRTPVKTLYDIVYFTGGYSVQWSPLEKDLGGSEQAVKHLASEWVATSIHVSLYLLILLVNR